jgi:hypothetical protein
MPAKTALLSPNPSGSSQCLVTKVDGVAVVPTALFGWSTKESTGSAYAHFRLHDGANVSSPALTAVISLSPGESARDWFGDQSLEVFNGAIYVEIVDGNIELDVYWG